MRWLLLVGSLAALTYGVIAAPMIAIVGLGGLVLSGLMWSAHRAKALRAASSFDEISPNDRVYLRPIRRLRDEIEALVLENSKSPAIKVIGGEAIQEANGILSHSIQLLKTRASLRKVLSQKGDPNSEINTLQNQIAEAASGEEKSNLELALNARQLELSHYGEIEGIIDRVDGAITQAQAALSEMKARIAVAAAGDKEGESSSEIEDTITRLRSLTKSFDEVEELMKVHI
ncbi:MAG TPA: hypothetical protein PKA27_03975 [Fimbriimonadaceae bacterium]|nr:hypothetical protein [Fimbriimonadaceae bacterium]